ncbi:hypothetical protein [Parasitella parasitica]|uniref:Uncharacterized protein n=1 Tax=Parasitella parasitica TaxID=35722 RepID=A0A0B7NES5_9FUNG|nr:hypothetical protein [Parasitella parasitica]
MTDTIGFDEERFRYHLKLYTDADRGPSKIISPYLKMPKSFSVKGSDIDYGTGRRYLREHTNRLKKKDDRRILQLEADLSRINLSAVTSIEELDEWETNQFEHANEIRQFYHSSHMARKTRQYELKRNKFVDRLCSGERKSCFGEEADQRQKRLLMFVGDRGLGIGSRVEGF